MSFEQKELFRTKAQTFTVVTDDTNNLMCATLLRGILAPVTADEGFAPISRGAAGRPKPNARCIALTRGAPIVLRKS